MPLKPQYYMELLTAYGSKKGRKPDPPGIRALLKLYYCWTKKNNLFTLGWWMNDSDDFSRLGVHLPLTRCANRPAELKSTLYAFERASWGAVDGTLVTLQSISTRDSKCTKH